MGRTIPTITEMFHRKRKAFRGFRGAIRRSDQRAMDELFVMVRQHMAAASYAAHPLPMETFLLSMLLEEHKKVERYTALIEKLEGEIEMLQKQQG